MAWFATTASGGTSCLDGVAAALPLKDGRAPVIDGRLDDWDRSGAVLAWNAEELAESENVALFFMYDEANFYVGAEMALGDHDNTNENRPQDRYWQGDLVQIRICTDPSLPHPLPRANRRDPDSPFRGKDDVTCINLWRNSVDGSDNLYVTPGAFFDCPNAFFPEGSAMKSTVGERSLTMEARIPWSALGVKDGKCPFAPGDRMAAVADIKWFPGSDGHATAAIYHRDPGSFAFLNIDTWGQIEFHATGNLPPSGVTFASIAAAARQRNAVDTTGYAEIRFNLPKKAKVSVNIFDEKGGVIRELIGGEEREAGEVAVYWDGRDALGFPCEAGRDYRWGAYAHDGLDVAYFGTVGTSGEPPYETKDRLGGWGSDHGPVVDAACDETGRYYVWHMCESGKGIVKTDFDGKVVWRTMPFVVDGWGNYSCLAAADGKVYLVYERRDENAPVVKLVKVDAATGNYDIWPSGAGTMDIAIDPAPPALPPGSAVRPAYAFNIAGIAVKGQELFISDFNGDRILVHDAETGEKTREIPVKGPRGLWLHDGALVVATLPGAVVRVDPETGATATLVAEGLDAPYGVAVDAAGRIHVSDLGASQQIKTFEGGKLVRTLGKRGGRGFLGKIDTTSFQYPFGLAVDKTGVLMVTEASTPKIVTLLDAATGETLRKYYGYTAYSPSNIPDPDDPLLQYYSLSGPDSFARARVPDAGGAGFPDASWDFIGAGIPEFGAIMNTMTMPEILKADNGRKYLVPDGTADHRNPTQPMTVCLVDGDAMKPVAGYYRLPSEEKNPKTHAFELWMDANGDHRMQPEEKVAVSSVEGRTFRLANTTGALHMTANGDLFILTMDNFVIGVPCRGFSESGVPQWDAAAAYIAIPEIIPGMDKLYCTWRLGLVGMRRDSEGNFYAAVACSPPYATEAYTKYMHQGMGHTADVGAVFMTKYDPEGRLLWRVGRKAVGGMKPGEILHHWCYAGLLNDEYSVAASEWGVFTLYTKDGFYVDHLFDIPGIPGRGIPYSFGGEDFSGRIHYFPERDEVWAYNAGHTFKVSGFTNGRVNGEWRTDGTVRLERVMPLVFPGAKPKPIGDVSFARRDGRLVFRAHVKDPTPLVNAATEANAVFKGGDAVGFEIGPATTPATIPERRPTGRPIGFTRVLAARMDGKDRVIAFKPFTDGEKRPQTYATPAGGTSDFEFVGDIPGATATFTLDADGAGYTAEIAVPWPFFELDAAKPVYGDAEALLSGDGGRGLQTVEKAYLHTPDSSATTMVDDVPTETRLHPAGWVQIDFED
jgi:hypothetical protein